MEVRPGLCTEMRVVRYMSGIKLQNRVPSKGLRERLGLGDIISVLQQTGCKCMGMHCKNKTMIG